MSITRQTEINIAKREFYERISDEELYYDPTDCFAEGAVWADKNPKSPWISVEEDLPFKHKELLYEIENFIHPSTKLVLIRTKENIYEVSFMYNNNGWQWDFELDKVTHWIPIPKLPKE